MSVVTSVLLKINNQVVPKLKEYSVTPEDLTVDAGRNLKGVLKATRVRTAIKLLLEFAPMTENEIQTLAGLLEPFQLTVQYYDPRSKTVKSGTFYNNTPNYGVLIKAKALYKPFSLNLIEF
jgi:hypothetical protein